MIRRWWWWSSKHVRTRLGHVLFCIMDEMEKRFAELRVWYESMNTEYTRRR